MRYDGFNTSVYSPAPKFLNGSEIAFLFDEDRERLLDQVRRDLLPLRDGVRFVAGVPGFEPTGVQFKLAGTAAAAFLSRGRAGEELAELHAAAFIFSGKSRTDDEVLLTRTSRGRDAEGRSYPIPPIIYERIRTDDVRPLMVLTLWNTATANDPSILAVAQAVFFSALPE
jgi:hypothetical protein